MKSNRVFELIFLSTFVIMSISFLYLLIIGGYGTVYSPMNFIGQITIGQATTGGLALFSLVLYFANKEE